MAPIIESVEIARSQADVFAYIADLERHGEWQQAIVSAKVETEGPVRVGTRVAEVRSVPGGRQMATTYEMTEFEPPGKASFEGVDGPVRAYGTVTVETVGDGSSSRVTLRLELKGHGLGRLLAPLAMREARRRVPEDQARLKARLEQGA